MRTGAFPGWYFWNVTLKGVLLPPSISTHRALCKISCFRYGHLQWSLLRTYSIVHPQYGFANGHDIKMLGHQLTVFPFHSHFHALRVRPKGHALSWQKVVPKIGFLVFFHEAQSFLGLVDDVKIGEEGHDLGEQRGKSGNGNFHEDAVFPSSLDVFAED